MRVTVVKSREEYAVNAGLAELDGYFINDVRFANFDRYSLY